MDQIFFIGYIVILITAGFGLWTLNILSSDFFTGSILEAEWERMQDVFIHTQNKEKNLFPMCCSDEKDNFQELWGHAVIEWDKNNQHPKTM